MWATFAERVADVKHRDRVEEETKGDIISECVMAADDVEIIMDALRSGKIRHIRIVY